MSQVLDKTKRIKKEGPAATRTAQAIEITPTIKLRDLAEKLGIEPSQLQKELMNYNFFGNINGVVNASYAQKIAERHGQKVVVKAAPPSAPVITRHVVVKPPKPVVKLAERPPVVTILGHVDHGKTTLLDYIRKTRVAEGEHGGITQRIGAYQVNLRDGQKITFIDTPGHAAFTAMRARGAKVTDIVVLMVAADDGVMPQTREAADHARAAGVPIIVAINKTDIPGVNVDRVLTQLSEIGLTPEEWGGETLSVRLSAKTGEGVDDLLENILLVASVHELQADPKAKPTGTVIEAEVDRGLGPVASVLVKEGTLTTGSAVVIGSSYGRIRLMLDDKGQKVTKAGPSTPVKLIGLQAVPVAGDAFRVAADEKTARAEAQEHGELAREILHDAGHRVTLEDVIQKIREGDVKQLNVILKGDNRGSVEAITEALPKQGTEDVRVHVVASSVGAVSESDVLLASASEALIVGFNIPNPDARAKRAAEDAGVVVRNYKIIYELLDDVGLAAQGLLKPVYEEQVMGHAQIRQLFRLPNNTKIAGCMVTDGRIMRSDLVRVRRGEESLWEGKLDSLRRVKDDVREVAQGFECGIVLAGFNEIQEGDVIEAYVMQEVARR
ncbi:MAG TPA: translation initiation factor IF-2 [Armatimonadota bacterium]|nr:translation initiation factor IF-2 [Armatimonadota bacterium]